MQATHQTPMPHARASLRVHSEEGSAHERVHAYFGQPRGRPPSTPGGQGGEGATDTRRESTPGTTRQSRFPAHAFSVSDCHSATQRPTFARACFQCLRQWLTGATSNARRTRGARKASRPGHTAPPWATVHARDACCVCMCVCVCVCCLLYTSPSPRDGLLSRMPSSA